MIQDHSLRSEGTSCQGASGTLPVCSPLAFPYVPIQQSEDQLYNQSEALSNGTLFPGLNLPFRLAEQGGKLPTGALSELQALEFVVLELGLYLDTHPEDDEAFQLFRRYTAMERSAKTSYERIYGPITRESSANETTYRWIQDPWPWNQTEEEVK